MGIFPGGVVLGGASQTFSMTFLPVDDSARGIRRKDPTVVIKMRKTRGAFAGLGFATETFLKISIQNMEDPSRTKEQKTLLVSQLEPRAKPIHFLYSCRHRHHKMTDGGRGARRAAIEAERGYGGVCSSAG